TTAEMAAQAGAGTAARVSGRDVVVIQDTTELILGGRRARASGYGPVGKGGDLSGLLLHPVLAVEAGTGALLGLVDLRIWNRKRGGTKPRRSRATAEKESQRWIDGTARAGEALAGATSITAVSDRESDIYEHFAARPANVELVVRACQNRLIEAPATDTSALLFSFIDSMPEQGRFSVTIPAAPGRKQRITELAVRFSPVTLRQPLHALKGDRPATLNLTIGDPRAMMNLVGAATVAAVTVMQLVKARDGTTDQPLTMSFACEDQRLLEAISCELEGKTALQKNPHPKASLAFAAWVMGRLGG